MALKLLVFLLLVCYVASQCKTPWQDCGSTDIAISTISVPDCCAPPCTVVDGKNATVTIEFQTKKDFSSMTQKLCGKLGVCVPFPGLPEDVCKFVKCPIKAGEKNTANVTLSVPAGIHNVTVIGEWTFYDPDKNKVGCFEVPLRVV